MSLGHDVRAALRQLLRRRLATSASVAVLALGIGSSVGLFSILDAVLLRPLPFPAAERLVALWDAKPSAGVSRSRVSSFNYLGWREDARSFEGLALLGSSSGAVHGLGEPFEVRGLRVTCDTFALLGVEAHIGRSLGAADCAPDAPGAILISHALWQRRFAGDPAALDRPITLAGEPVRVVGVLPPVLLPVDLEGEGRFRFAVDDERYWIPIREVRAAHGHVFGVLGRLRAGASLADARAELAWIARRLEQGFPESNTGFTVSQRPLADEVAGSARASLGALLTGALLLLLIACANVAQFQLTHVIERERASAVRAALGASRAQVVRPFLVEGLLLALAGGLLGSAFAQVAVRAAVVCLASEFARVASAGVHGRSQAAAFALTLACGTLTGLMAGSGAAGRGVFAPLRGGAGVLAPGAQRLRRTLLAMQAALAVVLVAGASLLSATLLRLARVDTGFDAGELLIVDLRHGSDRYRERHELVSFYDRVSERVEGLPGVLAVGASYDPPLRSNWYQSFRIVGDPAPRDGESSGGLFRTVTPGYFRAAGVAITEGRALDAADDAGSGGTAVVNQALAERYFGTSQALGRQISLTTTQWIWGEGVPRVFTIVGIAENERIAGLAVDPEPAFYLPYRQTPQHQMSLLIRTRSRADALRTSVARLIREIDPGQPIAEVTTIRSTLADALARPRLNAVLGLTFGLAALALAALGLSAGLAESVSRRQRELGVRLALGSSPARLFVRAMEEGVRPALVGTLAGAAGALACGPVLASQLYGVRPLEPGLHAAACAFVLVVALAACAAPAWRAARTDPAAALRRWS
jgi:predicted permease